MPVSAGEDAEDTWQHLSSDLVSLVAARLTAGTGGGGGASYSSSLGMSSMLGNFTMPQIQSSFTPPTISFPTAANYQQDMSQASSILSQLGATNPQFNASYTGALSSYFGAGASTTANGLHAFLLQQVPALV